MTLGRFKDVSELAEGGMGRVFVARDPTIDRRVVLKTLKSAVSPDRLEDLERLMTEARICGRLDHPHICPVLDVFSHGECVYIVFPFIEGETLHAILDDQRRVGSTDTSQTVPSG